MSEQIKPALTPREWEGVESGTVGLFGIPDANARHNVAAVCLYGQPFGFTHEDVRHLRASADALRDWASSPVTAGYVDGIAERIAALLPETS